MKLSILFTSALFLAFVGSAESFSQRPKPCSSRDGLGGVRKIVKRATGSGENDRQGDLRHRESAEDSEDCSGDLITDTLNNFWNNMLNKARTMSRNRSPADTENNEDGFFKRPVTDILSYFKPWWTGPNVCKWEEEEVKPASRNDLSNNRLSFFSSETSCLNTYRTYRCSNTEIRNGSDAVTKTTIYECCPGFERKNDQDRGCTGKIELNDLQQTLQNLNLTRFSEAATEAGLMKLLSNDKNFTIFAPSNEAFDTPTNKDDVSFVMLGSNDKLSFVRDVLSSHVSPSRLHSDLMRDEAKVPTLKNDSPIRTVFYNFPKSVITVNCAKITKLDVQASNGYVHIVDRVLPQANRNLLQILQDDPRFSIFLSVIDEKTKQQLADPDGAYTVFAFTDDAFEKLAKETKDRIKNKQSCVADMAKNHIATHTICGVVLVYNTAVRTLNSQMLIFNQTGEKLTVNNVDVVSKDRVASNGVLHVIDGVILFLNNKGVIDVLNGAGYDRLAENFLTGPVAENLGARNDTVIFLPPIRDVKTILDMNDTSARRRLVLNHVAVRNEASDGSATKNLKTLADATYDIKIEQRFSIGPFFEPALRTVGCAKLLPRAYSTCQGTVRFIDRPLSVPASDLMSALRQNSTPEKSTADFAFLVEASGSADQLKIDAAATGAQVSSRTILAPSDLALARYLSPKQRESLLKNKQKLREFVLRHVFEGYLCCDQLTGPRDFFGRGRTLVAESGARFPTFGSPGRRDLRVASSRVSACDRPAANGLVHTLTEPLPDADESPDRSSGNIGGISNFFESVFDDLLNFD